MIRTGIALAIVLTGCSKKDNKPATSGSGSAGSAATQKSQDGAAPAEFAAWMPADAQKQWEGAWTSRMSSLQSNKTKKHTTMAGDAVAIDVKGGEATVFDGGVEVKMKFTIASPCEARFTEPMEGGGSAYHDMMFVIANGNLVVGSGGAGVRKGKTAAVCSEGRDGGVTFVDDKGACTTWSLKFDKWESKPNTCVWSQDAGKDVLTIGTGDWNTKVVADGDVLMSDQFKDATKYHKRAKDYAEAKATLTAELKANDPIEQAKAAGGVAGKTDTIVSLYATFGSDPALQGKEIEITAQFFSQSSSTSNGKTTTNVSLVDSKDANKFTLSCDLGEGKPPEGIKQYDKVTAKGKVGEGFGKPELDNCTLAKAK